MSTMAAPEAATGERSPVAAGALVAVSWTVAAAAVVLWAVNRPTLDTETWFFVVDVTVAVVYGGVGALILLRRRHAVAWTFAVAAVGGAAAAFGWQYVSLSVERGPLPAATFLGSMAGWAWVPGTLALVTVVPWLVREPSGRPGPVGGAGTPVVVAVVVGWLVSVTTMILRLTDPAPWPEGEPFMPLAVESLWWADRVETALTVAFWSVLVLGSIATVDVARRWRAAPDRTASGLAWLLIGSAAMTVSFVPLVFPSHWVDGNVAVPTITPVLHLVSQAFLPAATIVVVLRQRLGRIDLALNRTLVHSLLSAALLVVYAVVVVVADQFLAGTGASAAIAAAVIAVLVLPLRGWLQQRVDRLVLGAAAAPDRALVEVGLVVGANEAGGGAAEGVAQHLAEAFRLASVTVVGEHDGGTDVVASVGRADGPVHHVPLVHGGRRVGRLDVSAPFGERLDTRTLEALGGVAPMIAATVTMARQNVELAAVGERLTEARLEERRILRRDLHDGLGPALAGIGLGLRAYRNLRETDPPAADALLDRLCDEVDQRVDDVRQLSRQLLPPVLDELGLAAALRELRARHELAGTHVRLQVGDLDDVDPRVAGAGYAIVSEAVMNAQRHGRPSTIDIAVWRDAELQVRVANDGTPFDPAATTGIGLRSMRERAAELGGHVHVAAERVADGAVMTVVRASLPVGVPA